MDLLKNAFLAVHRLGLANIIRIVRYSLQRDLQERGMRTSQRLRSDLLSPGLLKNTECCDSGAIFRFERASLSICYLAPDLARLSWEPGSPPLPYAISKTDWPKVRAELAPFQDGWQLASSELCLQISREGRLRYFSRQGVLLREELPPLHSENLSKDGSQKEIYWAQKAWLKPEAAIFGTGLRAFPMNLRGQTCRMWNIDPPGGYRPGTDPLYLCIPVFFVIHNQGNYLLFFENPFPGIFQFGRPVGKNALEIPAPSILDGADFAEVSFSGGMLRQYFIPGPPQRAMERYSELTGRPALPPRWSLGYHHSRWGFQDEAEIRSVIDGFKQHDLPISAIHLDIDYQDRNRVFTVDRRKFPDLPRLAQDLSQNGVRLVGILEPGVKIDRHYSVFREGLKAGVFCRRPDGKLAAGIVWAGWSAFPDFTAPHAREWWGQQYRHLLKLGFSGLWHDMNEPTSLCAWGEFSLPGNTCHSLEGRGADHLEAHNLYGLQMNATGYNALRKIKPDQRPWLLSRSGWAGSAPYAWNWTADLESSWDGLRQTIPSLLGLSLSGVPFCGSDIGGFQGNPDIELYLRWFQLAAFTPFFRTHSSIESPPREPWRFGEPALSIIRKYLQLRFRLAPYLYTLAWRAAQSGTPIIRPMFWDHPDVPELWQIDDQFLLGEALLVAPILEPGVKQRIVRLPPGIWYSFWDGEKYQGPAEAVLPARLDQIPLFVRAGSLLPMDECDWLVLHYYPTEEGFSTAMLYDDPGDGYGISRIDWFTIQWKEDLLEIERISEGDFPSAWPQLDLQVHGMAVHHAWADGRPQAINQNCVSTCWFNHLVIRASYNNT